LHSERAYYERYYAPLAGATIESVAVSDEDMGGYSEPWLKMKVKLSDGSTTEIEVSQDEEGNGPGFLFGLPIPEREMPDGPYWRAAIQGEEHGRTVYIAGDEESARKRAELCLVAGEKVGSLKLTTEGWARRAFDHHELVRA
jgi:hypothetical protein